MATIPNAIKTPFKTGSMIEDNFIKSIPNELESGANFILDKISKFHQNNQNNTVELYQTYIEVHFIADTKLELAFISEIENVSSSTCHFHQFPIFDQCLKMLGKNPYNVMI